MALGAVLTEEGHDDLLVAVVIGLKAQFRCGKAVTTAENHGQGERGHQNLMPDMFHTNRAS